MNNNNYNIKILIYYYIHLDDNEMLRILSAKKKRFYLLSGVTVSMSLKRNIIDRPTIKNNLHFKTSYEHKQGVKSM